MSFFTSYVIRTISSNDYYKKRLLDWTGQKGTNISCPFAETKHEHGTDTSRSFSVDIGLVGGCFCHACKTKIANILHFEKEIVGLQSDEDAARSLYSEFIHPVIDFEGATCSKITSTRKHLRENPKVIANVLKKELRFSDEMIDKFCIGIDPVKKDRITFPVFNQWGALINVRYYAPPSCRKPGNNGKYPKIFNEKGYGQASLFPLNLLEQTPNPDKVLYWMKAERDTILAWSLGLQAFCTTGGENLAARNFLPYIKRLGCHIVVVGDNDEVGLRERDAKIVDLQSASIPCGYVEIPEPQKDFSDWIIRENKTSGDFQALEEITNEYRPVELPSEEVIYLAPNMSDPTIHPLDGMFEVVDIGRRPELLNIAIKVNGVISGHLDRTFSIPYIFEVEGSLYRIPISRELLQLIRSEDIDVQQAIKKILITRKDVKFRQFITVTEVEIVPVLTPGVDSVYVNQRCYFFGERIESNVPYELSVIPTSSMKTQETVGLIYSAKPISNILDEIALTMEDVEELHERFSPPIEASGETIYLRMNDLAYEIADRHTLIYNRTDLHLMQLLTWCCPIQFNFHCEGVQRGWLNSLVFGDTMAGKSVIAKKLQELFSCGAFVNSENCTFMGLVGGAVKSQGGMFMLRWGKIPLYNRQLIVLEELSGLSCEEISNMSEVRSSGVAKIDKGGLSGETSARTRLLCISNVRRKFSNLSDYANGMRALQELVGQNEDISRFDLILTVTDNEVSNEIINRDRTKGATILYSEEEMKIFKKLVAFIWSLKLKQIEITDDAYRKCLTETQELCKIYHASIPIFKGGSGRLKLARIACAIAALQFSWDAQKAKLIVKDTHVRAASILLKKFYNKPSLGYGKYSKQQYFLERLSCEDKLRDTIDKTFSTPIAKLNFFRYLAVNGSFEKQELCEALELPSIIAERVISIMQVANAIRKESTSSRLVWTTTMPGRRWIEKNTIE